jgi:RNA recognition motif-containing protein
METKEQTVQAPSSCNIYISKLNSGDEVALRAALSSFGELTDLFVKRRGAYGFASFTTISSAEQACSASPIAVGKDSCIVEMRRSKPFDPNLPKEPRDPAPASCNIYINNLKTADKAALKNVLEKFGELVNIKLNEKDGYAFATYTKQEMSQAAVNVSPIIVGNDTCIVEMRRSAPRSKGKNAKKRGKSSRRPPMEQQLYIKGLLSETTEDDIRSALAEYGDVHNVYRRRLRGEQKGLTDYAFVTFANKNSVLNAASANLIISGSSVVGEPRRPRNAAATTTATTADEKK